jgi:hypothetical protein
MSYSRELITPRKQRHGKSSTAEPQSKNLFLHSFQTGCSRVFRATEPREKLDGWPTQARFWLAWPVAQVRERGVRANLGYVQISLHSRA